MNNQKFSTKSFLGDIKRKEKKLSILVNETIPEATSKV